MDNRLKLIVGLGNPGAQYQGTRHNAGQDFVESLAGRFSGDLKTDSKYYGRLTSIQLGDQSLRLLIPDTFMNRSGKAVAALSHFFKISAEQILAAHDELDMPAGTAKLKFSGGHGGHNGLRDIISSLGNARNFYRLRIGIGHPGAADLVSDYVLSKASADDRIAIQNSIDKAVSVAPDFAQGNWPQAMQLLHSNDADDQPET